MECTKGFGIDVANELSSLNADPRLRHRSRLMLQKWQEKPDLGFPQIFDDGAELESAYRFFSNPNLSFQDLLKPHTDETIARCEHYARELICIQDTSAFVFSGERRGLGFINPNSRGFLGHFALAVSRREGETPIPMGVVAASTWIRTTPRCHKDIPQHQLRSSGDSESLRWLKTTRQVEESFKGRASLIHVMDREGDIYDSLSVMVAENMRFVVRAMSNRIIDSEEAIFHLLYDALDGLPVRYRDTVSVSPRKASKLPKQKKAYPERQGRQAEVCVSATTVTLRRPRSSSNEYAEKTSLHVVHVFEPNAPVGEDPVEWILLTDEPITTEAGLRGVVECYRQRWIIEEFFKAIKTGCAYEKRQLETYEALQNALAMTLPLAWSMLLLRAQSRSNVPVPATAIVDPFRLQVLRAHAVRYKLPEQPTLKDVAYAVAGMGGHLKRNGPPGWQTLRRGFEKLLTLEEGWMMSRKTCDQS